MKYICGFCNWIYDEIIEGMDFDNLEEDWECPICRSKKIKFMRVIEGTQKIDINSFGLKEDKEHNL